VDLPKFAGVNQFLLVDFVVTFPDNYFITLYSDLSGTNNAIVDSVLEIDQNSVVAIKPISGSC